MFDCFKKKKQGLKWGRVICHSLLAEGANTVRADEIVSENRYCRSMYGHMKIHTDVGTRDIGGLAGAYGHLRGQGCTATIEAHLNAFNGKASGYEVLCLKGDKDSMVYAERWLGLMSKHFPDRRNRGTKLLVKGDRGYKNLKESKLNGSKVALLTEAFFLDNPKDWIDPEILSQVFDELITKEEL